MNIRPFLSCFLTFVILLGIPLGFSACSNKDVASATADIVSSAQSVVIAMKAVAPADSAGIAKLEHFVQLADKFQADLAAALTPDDQVKLLPTITALLETFQADVLPRLHVSVSVGIAIAGIDAGLRIVANHFKNLSTNAPTVARVAGRRAARTAGVDIEAAKATIEGYMATPKVRAPRE